MPSDRVIAGLIAAGIAAAALYFLLTRGAEAEQPPEGEASAEITQVSFEEV